MPLHIVGISGGRVWRTTRISEKGGWTPWNDIFAAGAGPLPVGHTLNEIGCALVDDAGRRLHICVSSDNDGLFHTIELAPGAFQPWGDAAAVAFSNLQLDSRVDCAGMGNQLHVCVAGRPRPGSLLPAVWRSIRIPTGWSPPRAVSSNYLTITNVACAAVPNGSSTELHVLSRVDTGGQVELIHNIWLPTGNQQPLGDQDMIPVVLGLSGRIFSMSATGFANALDVVVSDGINLFHTRRTPTMWSALINLRAMIQPSFSGPLQVPACAIVGGNLHICATSNGSIMHAIRLANGTFHNPESSPGSVFGDVTGTVLTGANGSIPPPSFSQIACAGDPF